MVVGIGSGSTVVFAVQRLAERVRAEGLELVCIPTSFQALQLIRENGLTLGDLSSNPEIDVTIDGADELAPDLSCIKGGGGCHVQEKIVASCSKSFVVICDGSKRSDYLGQKWRRGVPIEVIPMAAEPVLKRLRELGAREPSLRMAKSKMGPVVSDNGNFIIDADFGELGEAHPPEPLNQTILCTPGVVESGLFLGMACKAYIGGPDGVRVLEAPTV